jgi:hypothetical protein
VVGDDAGEEAWEVEGICDRELDDGGLEFLVKWKDGEETWEPYENVADTKALHRLHRIVTVDTVDAHLGFADGLNEMKKGSVKVYAQWRLDSHDLRHGLRAVQEPSERLFVVPTLPRYLGLHLCSCPKFISCTNRVSPLSFVAVGRVSEPCPTAQRLLLHLCPMSHSPSCLFVN